MKKLLLFSLIGLLIFTGCGKKEEAAGNGYLVSTNDSILDSYETHQLQEGITYKIIESSNETDIRVNIVVYNNTDEAVEVKLFGEGYKDGYRTRQTTQVSLNEVSPHNSTILGLYFMKADSYKITKMSVEKAEDLLPKDAFKLESYENGTSLTGSKTVNVYFKYNSNGDNLASMDALGFKGDKLVATASSSIISVNDNDILKSGDKGKAELNFSFIDKNVTLDDIDKIVYTVNGYYE